MENKKIIKNSWLNPLSFLDNSIFNFIITIILVIYSSGIFEKINILISKIYNYTIIRFLFILLIIYISYKDLTLAILLTIFYLVSLHYIKSKEDFGGGLCIGFTSSGKCIVSPT